MAKALKCDICDYYFDKSLTQISVGNRGSVVMQFNFVWTEEYKQSYDPAPDVCPACTSKALRDHLERSKS